MKYAMCPSCWRSLCSGEPGTKVELECPNGGKPVAVISDMDDLLISSKPLPSQDRLLKQNA